MFHSLSFDNIYSSTILYTSLLQISSIMISTLLSLNNHHMPNLSHRFVYVPCTSLPASIELSPFHFCYMSLEHHNQNPVRILYWFLIYYMTKIPVTVLNRNKFAKYITYVPVPFNSVPILLFI